MLPTLRHMEGQVEIAKSRQDAGGIAAVGEFGTPTVAAGTRASKRGTKTFGTGRRHDLQRA